MATGAESVQEKLDQGPGAPVIKQEQHASESDSQIADHLAMEPSEADLPHGISFALVIFGTFLATFIVALDNTIVAPAIPYISNDFHTLTDVTWYLSIYFATSTAFMATFGPFFRLNLKYVYLLCIFIFELGSLICAVAPNSNTFIGGRAVAGLGVAGGYVGTMAIVAKSTSIQERAKYSNVVGGAYALGAVTGPLIGGAFTSKVTWRWNFYINLPLGGLTIAAIIFCFKEPKKPAGFANRQAWIRTFKDADWVGSILIFASLICYLIAMQWGGIQYAWNDSKIIGLIIGFGLMLIALIPWCWYRKDKAILPPRIMANRTVAAASLTNVCIGGAYFSVLTFLAIYFQIRGSSAIRSGAGVVFGLMVGGGLVAVVGYIPPFLYFSVPVFCLGVGTLVLFDQNTSTAMWAGCTFLVGVGAGMAWQMPFVCSQTVVEPKDLEVATACVIFTQTWGGALAFSANQAIYQNFFLRGVLSIPDLPNARQIGLAGVTAFRQLAPPQFVDELEVLAIDSLRRTWYLCIALLGFAVIFFVPWIKWVNLKPEKNSEAEQTALTKDSGYTTTSST